MTNEDIEAAYETLKGASGPAGHRGPSTKDMMQEWQFAFGEAVPFSVEAWVDWKNREEIPVTDEMIAAGEANCPVVAQYRLKDIYRAMAAVAPTGDLLAQWNKLVRHDLIDQCAEKDLEIAALRTERDGWQKLYEDRVNRAQLLSFGVTSDTPEPPRRPDGTLVPTAKPWSVPKPSGDPRRIGG